MVEHQTSDAARGERLRFGVDLLLFVLSLFFLGLVYMYWHLRAGAERIVLRDEASANLALACSVFAVLTAWLAVGFNWLGRTRTWPAGHALSCAVTGFGLLLTMVTLHAWVGAGYTAGAARASFALLVLGAAQALALCVAWMWMAVVLHRPANGVAAGLAGRLLVFVAVVASVVALLPGP